MNMSEYIIENEIKGADLILIRGVPGSGKSTYAKKHFPNHRHLEADQFHMKGGKYDWKPENVKKSHDWCQKETEAELDNDKKVVVSNTFTTLKEMTYYIELAKKMNKKIKVLRMTTQFKNVHNVPEEVLEKMKKRFQDFTGEVKV
jgi:predicted kinase